MIVPISNGFGPTRLISSLITLIRSISLSGLALRKKGPKEINHLSSGIRLPWTTRALVIVRNLIRMEGFLYKPNRCWRKKTWLGKLSLAAKATTGKMGVRMSGAARETNISSSRFVVIVRSHPLFYAESASE